MTQEEKQREINLMTSPMTTEAIKQAILFHGEELWNEAISDTYNSVGGIRAEINVSYPDILPGGIEAVITLTYRFLCRMVTGGEPDERIPEYRFDWVAVEEILLFAADGASIYCDANVNEIQDALNEQWQKDIREF